MVCGNFKKELCIQFLIHPIGASEKQNPLEQAPGISQRLVGASGVRAETPTEGEATRYRGHEI